MASLYFYYGAMGSSKTANALMTRFNYEERGQTALMVKPRLDTREDSKPIIRSRIGLEYPCIYFDDFMAMKSDYKKICKYDCIIVDEAQFLTRDEVLFLTWVVDTLDIPVVAYGLRSDFQGNLFPGSETLLALADKIQEVKTVCWCGRKAIMNARYSNGKIVRTGDQIQIGANDSYVALCRKHWKTGQLFDSGDVED